MKILLRNLLALSVTLLFTANSGATTIYVKSSATGINNGSSWANAYTSLQTALSAVVSGDQIWVAAGTYKPAASGGSRDAAFYIAPGVQLYGHFAGTETTVSQRVLTNASYATVLSGDLNGDSGEFTNQGDNSNYVVRFEHTGSEVLLDGFTVTQAYSSGIYVNGSGGAASSPTLRNCLITLNTGEIGAGIRIDGYNSSATCVLTVDNCRFEKNKTRNTGRSGAIEADYNVQLDITNSTFTNNSGGVASAFYADGNCTISGCTFTDNYNYAEVGGLIHKMGGTLNVTNCLFQHNGTSSIVSVLYLFSCNTTINGSTFRNNYSLNPEDTNKAFNNLSEGGAILNKSSSKLKIYNSIFENNYNTGIGEYFQPGGAICNLHSLLLLENCLFRGNYGDMGGAIYSSQLSADKRPALVSIKNSAFTGNRAQYWGGAVCLEKTNSLTADPYSLYGETNFDKGIINCTFNGNICGYVGDYPESGGLFSLYGGAVYLSESPQVFKNSIIWDNSAPNGGNEIYNASTPNHQPAFYFSDIKESGGSAAWNTTLGIDGGSNLDVNPGFITSVTPSSAVTTTGNVRISRTSPCADSGNNTYMTLANDLDGNARILDATVDLGAYESRNIAGSVIYVNSAATYGSQEGKSFTNGYTTLQQALDVAVAGDQIWIAKGTYKPTSAYSLTNTSRYYHFELKNGVAIYGGFAGTETSIDQRTNFGFGETNETILSGDIGVTGDYSDNCYHVVYNSEAEVTNTAILNGVTISGGNANGTNPHNRGGGLYNHYASPTINQVVFTGNKGNYGGGAFNHTASPLYINCLFFNNHGNTSGGGMRQNYATTTVSNCTFANNTAGSTGGGVDNNFSSAIYNNCIIWGNSAPTGNQIYSTGDGTSVLNYSCYANQANDVATLDVAVLNTSNSNISTNPLFVNTTNNDFRLYGSSPCANVGNNTFNSTGKDTRNQTRIQNTTIDMGAFEWTSGIDPDTKIVYVNTNASGSNNGSSWTNAFNSLQSALSSATAGTQIWVAKGTYKPSVEFDGTTDNSLFFTFKMVEGVKIYGGFTGIETAINQRSDYGFGSLNETILSGDLLGNDEFDITKFASYRNGSGDDNCYNVLFNLGNSLTSATSLDGFTIRGGNAITDFPGNHGAGMITDGHPTLRNIVFYHNFSVSGGALFVYGANGIEMSNLSFIENNGGDEGGGLFTYESQSILTNSLFFNNKGGYGGGLDNVNSTTTINNSTFSGNIVRGNGGAIQNTYNGTLTLNNCVIWNNSAISDDSEGNEIFHDGNTISLNNCCYRNEAKDVYGTPTLGSGNIITDPLFVSAISGDLRLYGNSPCVNTGKNSYNTISTDIRGQVRIQNTTIDMGAYEWTSGIDPATNITTKIERNNFNSCISVYPNPSNGVINFCFTPEFEGNTFIDIFSITGEFVCRVFEGTPEQGTYQTICFTKQLAEGLYIYKMTNGTVVKTGRLVRIVGKN